MLQSTIKKPFFLRYKDKSLPKILPLNETISQIIPKARQLFDFSDDDNIKLKINGQIQDGDIALQDLGLKGQEQIEVILVEPPQDRISIYICLNSANNQELFEWETSLSASLNDVQRTFCKSKAIDPDLYSLYIDGKPMNGNTNLNDIPGLDAVVVSLEKKQGTSNVNPLKEEVDAKEIRLMISGYDVYELSLNWLANVRVLKSCVTESLDFPPNVVQRWSIGGKELNDQDSLKNQMKFDGCTVDIDRLTPFLFSITAQNKTIQKSLHIDPYQTVGHLKQEPELSNIIMPKSQVWLVDGSKEPLQDDEKLVTCTKDRSDLRINVEELSESILKVKSQTKKIYSFKYGDAVIRKQFPIDEDITVIIQAILKSFQISKDIKICLEFNGKVMDPEKSISDYMKSPEGTISVVPQQEQGNSLKVTFTLNGKEKQLSAIPTQTIKVLRDQACSAFEIKTPYLYSVFFGNKVLKLTQTLKDVENFSENTCFDLCSMIEVKLVNQTRFPLEPITFFNPDKKIFDLKAQIASKCMMSINSFDLFIGLNSLEDDQKLSYYKRNDDEIVIVVKPAELKPQAPYNEIGKHVLPLTLKTIFVILPYEKKEYTYGGDLKTVGDLKNKLEKLEDIPASKQILILLRKEEWQNKLSNINEDLAALATQGEDHITILCKTSKKIAVILGMGGKIEAFEGIFGASITEHKKLFEMAFNVPVTNQIWSIGKANSSKLMEDSVPIENYGIQAFDEANPVQIFRKINITVCINEKTEILADIPTYENIAAQKAKISKQLAILPEDQLWRYGEKELTDDKILEECFTLNLNTYAVDLIILNDFEYFGFTNKSEININLFKNFFIESEEELDQIIESVTFDQKESGMQFRNKVLGLFFGILKKHSMWENLISKIKKRTFDIKGVNLWKGNEKNKAQQSKFNTQFLLYYFLNSGNSELNVEILNIMKMHFPVPLAINSWANRFSVEGSKILNDLYWVFQKSFVVTSFGFGGAETKVCGKTELINQILFSNFVKDSERNHICRGCPEILFDIYKNDKYPVNLIDIPAGTNEEIRNKIIANSNMLIIHSLASQKETLEYLQRLPNKVPTIVLYRDIPGAFLHIKAFRENLSNSLKTASTTNVFEVKIVDLSDDERSNELNEISSRVHEYILTTFQATDDKNLWKFFGFFEGHNQLFHTILDRIRDNSSHLAQAVPVFTALKKLEKSKNVNDQKVQDESAKLQMSLEKKPLTSEINELMNLLMTSELVQQGTYSEKPKLLLQKLQDYLRTMKSQQTSDFYKLYEFKSSLSASSSINEAERIRRFQEFWNTIKMQNVHYQGLQLDPKATKQQVMGFIDTCIEIFEQKITSNIFSIELFWRELVYFTNMKRNYDFKVDLSPSVQKVNQKESVQLFDFLIRLKKEHILNGFPFEVIDGDLLYMSKDFLKTVFKGLNDRVIIVSILGPQSSGKSTLLNFLFGCNFLTSSGRCTKGVYGTYFKVSNFNSCDGILVLDTEGLFGLLTKGEEEQRDKFDRKLVLFCLAISDFVLINFKGDIDKTLTDVLTVCKESLSKLEQGNIGIPEIFLILNQNTQTNINTQLQDINKMGNMGFSRSNVYVLPLAFEVHVNENSTIERYMDRLTKKTPKKEFFEKCTGLAQKIFEKIRNNSDSKKQQRTLEDAMDRMEHLWELLNKFPDFIKYRSAGDQGQEENIKKWIEAEIDEKFKRELLKYVEDFKNSETVNVGWEHGFQDYFAEVERKIKRGFLDIFQEKTNPILFRDMENSFHLHTSRIRTEVLDELVKEAQSKEMRVYDMQGVKAIHDAACRLKGQPNMSKTEKDKYFEETWASVIIKMAGAYNREKEADHLLEIVKENYRTNLITLKEALPTMTFPLQIDLSFDAYQELLFFRVEKDYSIEQAFEYTKQAPVLVFRGGKGDITFKYFDLRKYFEHEELEEFIGLPKAKVYELINGSQLREDISMRLKQPENKASKGLLTEVQKELEAYGLVISLALLEKTLEHKKHTFSKKWLYAPPVEQEEIGSSSCSEKPVEVKDQQSFKYILPDLIKAKHDAWKKDNQATFTTFFSYVLSSCILWDKIIPMLEERLWKMYSEADVSEIIKQLNGDMKKINLKFTEETNIHEKIVAICCKEPDEYKLEINNAITECSPNVNFAELKDIPKQEFAYINQDILQGILQKTSSDNTSQYFVVGKCKTKKVVVKKDFQQISWLSAYAKEQLDRIFVNTTQDKALLTLVLQQFSLKALLDDIFQACVSILKQLDNWTFTSLYQIVTRGTNDLIGTANNDLQQISCHLSSGLVGQIHLTVVYLIWKYFEPKHWEKVTEPVTAMRQKKEKQKKYFDAIASTNHNEMNANIAEKTQERLENYINHRIISQSKKDIIMIITKRFQTEVTRKQIQDEIESKYFLREVTDDNSDLYLYLLNPYEILLQTYEESATRYLKTAQSQILKKQTELNALLQDLLQRITDVQQTISSFGENFWSIDNVFEFQGIKDTISRESLFDKNSEVLSKIYYAIVMGLLMGDRKRVCLTYSFGPDKSHTVSLKGANSLKISLLSNKKVLDILDDLDKYKGKVTNALTFIKSLREQVKQLSMKSAQLLELKKEDIKEFQNKINVFICKERCPCCDRICDIEDPYHVYHQCRYGHQIRALGGVMIENREPSLLRCEEINDIDKMQYNGQEMTWAEFKYKMRTRPFNPWSYDDIAVNRDNKEIKGKLKIFWTLVGRKICEEKYKNSRMQYVSYDQATTRNQHALSTQPKNYIYMIDSSSSMKRHNKWTELLQALKRTFAQIDALNQNNRVTVINFSTDVKIEFKNQQPNRINVYSLEFQNEGTEFEEAFGKALEFIKTIKQNDIVLTFMTDGEGEYPYLTIQNFKQYLTSPAFRSLKINFTFSAVKFKCKQRFAVDLLVKELGGSCHFAGSGDQLTKTFMEILDKHEN